MLQFRLSLEILICKPAKIQLTYYLPKLIAMKHNSASLRLRKLLFTVLCFTCYSSFSQKTYNQLIEVDSTFTSKGKETFKINIKDSTRNKATEQVIVSYNTLKKILEEASPESNIAFFFVGINKNDTSNVRVWGELNNITNVAGMEILDNKQALIVEFYTNPKTQIKKNNELQKKNNNLLSSSLKFANQPFSPSMLNYYSNRALHGPTPDRTYYAMGKLCPPPVCPGN